MPRTAWIAMLLFAPAFASESDAQQTTISAVPAMLVFASPKDDAGGPPACPAKFADSLESNGIAGDFRHGVKAPKATYQPEAEFSDKARKAIKKQHIKFFNGVSILSIVVGVDGVPRDICVKQPAGYGLDEQAAKAASRYRFEPAIKDGSPVPARIAIEVNFRLY